MNLILIRIRKSMVYYLIINKIRKTICISLLIIMLSCKNESHFVSKHYYSSGELLSEISHRKEDSVKDGVFYEYYKNGNLKNKASYVLGKKSDTLFSYFDTGELKLIEIFKKDSIHTINYYKNGKKSLEGSFLNREKPIETGWFKLYRKNGNIKDSLEYINVNGQGYLNQRYHFDKNKQVVLDSSRYYSFQLSQIKDSIYQYKIKYVPMIKDTKVYLIVDSDVNEDFSNIKDLEMDTIFMENNSITATITSNKPYKTLKGLFHEYKAFVKDTVSKDSIRMTIKEKRTYFNNVTYPDRAKGSDL